ncbi:MAG: hypothetical protein AB1746_16735 [Candidatus Zixiibacteriota bacterium]
MLKRVSSLLLALALIIWVAGCSKAPEVQIKASEDAMQQAALGEAEQYAPETYMMAMDSLNAAKAEKQAQDGKFALFRKYGKSEEMYAAAQRLAEQAFTEAEANKEQVRVENLALVAAIDTLMAEVNKAVAGAPKGKGTRADLALIKSDLATIDQSYKGAVAEHDAGKYLSAKAKLEAVREQLNRIKSELEAAKSKTGTK